MVKCSPKLWLLCETTCLCRAWRTPAAPEPAPTPDRVQPHALPTDHWAAFSFVLCHPGVTFLPQHGCSAPLQQCIAKLLTLLGGICKSGVSAGPQPWLHNAVH